MEVAKLCRAHCVVARWRLWEGEKATEWGVEGHRRDGGYRRCQRRPSDEDRLATEGSGGGGVMESMGRRRRKEDCKKRWSLFHEGPFWWR